MEKLPTIAIALVKHHAHFHRAAKHENLLSMEFLPEVIKTGSPTKFPFVAHCLLLVFSLFAYPEYHVEIWLVILFLS